MADANYGVGGKLLKAVQSFYVVSRACIRAGNDVREWWFPVKVGLRQGCVMPPWLFNVYMDGVVRKMNVMVFRKDWNCSVRMVAGLRKTSCYLQMIQH